MLDHFPLPCRVRTTRRRGSIGLRVGRDEIRILAPRGTPLPVIEQLLRERRQWIETAIRAQQEQPLRQRGFCDGETLHYRGASYPLRVTTDPAEGLRFDGQAFRLQLAATDTPVSMRRQLVEQWYLRQAQQCWPGQLQAWAERTGLQPASLKIRSYKSRWGACTARGAISLNTLLLMAPDEVQEYVMIHELCHLRHLNHSADYWTLVASWCPAYRSRRNWLRQHGRELHFN